LLDISISVLDIDDVGSEKGLLKKWIDLFDFRSNTFVIVFALFADILVFEIG